MRHRRRRNKKKKKGGEKNTHFLLFERDCSLRATAVHICLGLLQCVGGRVASCACFVTDKKMEPRTSLDSEVNYPFLMSPLHLLAPCGVDRIGS